MADNARPLIIKRAHGEHGHAHHGGAWKVAYADFVTAMMAFFLLLWLLNATTEEQRAGLADYFDPSVPISPVSGGGTGVLGGEVPFSRRALPGERVEGARPEAREGDGGGAEAVREGAVERAIAAAEDEAARERAVEALEAAAAGLDDAEGHLSVRAAPDGLVIELVDLAGEPLFAPGSARATPLFRDLVAVVVRAIAPLPNAVEIIGHTDAAPFASASRTNWELSAERAATARRLLVASGLAPERLRAVIGRAATEPIGPDPLAPGNRRVAVKLLALAGERDPAPAARAAPARPSVTGEAE
ncbi:MAG: flagellar motor protein MotB [Paracoccaceae bacterium]